LGVGLGGRGAMPTGLLSGGAVVAMVVVVFSVFLRGESEARCVRREAKNEVNSL
jgi:hypothetical protein